MVRLSDFDYDLPEELIAQHPLTDRAAARLLHLDPTTGAIQDRMFREVVDILQAGDVLILNNTRVNSWRFFGRKETGGQVEILALREIDQGIFESMIKPAKRLKPGAKVFISPELTATILEGGDDVVRHVHIETNKGDLHAELSKIGKVPLPPYITAQLEDPERYQTVFSALPGSAAAPTAGLHFTQEILENLREKGVQIGFVTLHVSIDTFRPIQVDDVNLHKMHGEFCEISEETSVLINGAKGRVIAVGTTAVRTLETFAVGPRQVAAGSTESYIFIKPGDKFKVIDGMFTNFHFPRTTMLLMISALAGKENVLAAYKKAVEWRYRFLSFGDSMLILKNGNSDKIESRLL